MQSLKLQFIEKLTKTKKDKDGKKIEITNFELAFILEISKYQDETGKVTGVHYQDISDRLGISYRKFYDIKKSLEEKNIIQTEKSNRIDWDITLVGNDFSDKDFKCGYTRLDKKLFQSRLFKELKVKEKLLAIHFLNLYNLNHKRSFRKNEKDFIKDLCTLLCVEKRMIYCYLKNLKGLFSIGIKAGKYYITPKKPYLREEKGIDKLDIVLYNKERLKSNLRRIKAQYIENSTEFKETFHLLRQYAKKNITVEHLCKAINDSIAVINQGVKNIYTWKRYLNPALVHIELKKYIENPNLNHLTQEKDTVKNKNRFNNFPQRSYDEEFYSNLEKTLLKSPV